jgi:hypothetical protein
MGQRTEKIRKRVLIPIGIVLVCLIFLFIASSSWLQKSLLVNKVGEDLTRVQWLLNLEIKSTEMLLRCSIDLVESLPGLGKYSGFEDRDGLLDYVYPTFKRIKDEYGITHLEFIETDKTSFLRVHRPYHVGGIVSRRVLADAASKGKTTTGLEVGPAGNLAVRSVRPWEVNQKLVGYIETGQSFQDLAEKLSGSLGIDLVMLIEKTFLEKSAWQEVMV